MQAIIFTDGSSRGNPGPGGWGAVVVEGDSVKEYGGREVHTTNNRMELTAVVEALSHTDTDEAVVHTDSSYLISGITSWIVSWKKNNWQTKTKEDVSNRDLWEALDTLVSEKKVSFVKVDGHAGIPGNERCDVIATSYADEAPVVLYDGSLSSYTVDITETKSLNLGDKKKKSSKNSSPAYSYVSMVGGVIEAHRSWEECKARVHGVSGTRFKKSQSAEDEKNIISEFKKQ